MTTATFPRLLLDLARQRPDGVAMQEKLYGIWQPLTWADYRQRVQEDTRQRPKPGLVESVASSTAFRQFTRTAAREIVRGLFGAGRRR